MENRIENNLKTLSKTVLVNLPQSLQLIHLTNLLRCKKSGSQLNLRNLRVRTTKLREQLKILFKQSVHINLINMWSQFQLKKSKNFQSITTGQCIKPFSTLLNTHLIRWRKEFAEEEMHQNKFLSLSLK